MGRARLGSFLKLLGLCVVLGVVVGVVWFLVAPTPAFVQRGTALGYVKDLPSEYVAMDGWFAVLSTVAGIVVAIVVLRRGRLDPWAVLAVGLTGLVGALTAWGVGRALGRDERSATDGRLIGEVLHGPLTLSAKGVLLFWPVVSLAILTFALAWSSRDERPVEAAADHDAEPAEPDEPADPTADAAPASVGGDGDLGGLDRGQ